MDTDSFIIDIETDDFFEDIADDVDEWFDTSKYNKKDNRPLTIGKNKKKIDKFKDELNGQIMTEFIALRAKTYAFIKINEEDELKNINKLKEQRNA